MEERTDVVVLVYFSQFFAFLLFFYCIVVLLVGLWKFGMAETCFFLAQGAYYTWQQSAGSKREVPFLGKREKAQQHNE